MRLPKGGTMPLTAATIAKVRPVLARPVRDDGDSVQKQDVAIIMRAAGNIEILIPKDAIVSGREMTRGEVLLCAIGCRMMSEPDWIDEMIEWMNDEFDKGQSG
jgi:hypothetical protein